MPLTYLPEQDPAVADALRQELARERDSVELIASENFVSETVMAAAMELDKVRKAAEGMTVVKTILVKDKLMNLIVKPAK